MMKRDCRLRYANFLKMKEYGLIGRKLGHSFSAKYFNEKFAREGIDARYELFEIPSIEGVSDLLSEHPELVGLNVTIPYKRDILPYCTTLTESASEIGAVNTVKIERLPGGMALHGHNTDAPGFAAAIEPMLGGVLKEPSPRALVLGQGGASLAVIYALRKMGIGVTKVSRHASEGVITYADLTPEVMAAHLVIVNCTPLGMWPETDACADIPYDCVSELHVCFDLVYNPEETEFMKRCAAKGAKVSNGLQMLHNQADLAWEFWNN